MGTMVCRRDVPGPDAAVASEGPVCSMSSSYRDRAVQRVRVGPAETLIICVSLVRRYHQAGDTSDDGPAIRPPWEWSERRRSYRGNLFSLASWMHPQVDRIKYLMPEDTATSSPRFTDEFRSQFRQLLVWRRDVRRFRPDPVDRRIVSELLDLACLAPSVGNSQPWRFVIVNED